MRLWRRLKFWWLRRGRKRARGSLELKLSAKATRLGRIAEREGIDIETLEDALVLIAGEFPVTVSEVLDVVDAFGLGRARGKLEAMICDP